jgi:glutathione S-transferase
VKLYNLDHSPFATRVRMQIHKKNLDIVIEPPPEAPGTPQFFDRFPMGKIPVLELDDGSTLPDSWVIMEYLEDVMPASSLRPEGATARAHMQLLARYADTYLAPSALTPLFGRVTTPGGTENAGELLEALDKELARLQRVLQALPDFRQRELHLGDIALAPHMDYVLMLAPMFGLQNPLEDHSLVAAWWEWVSSDSAVARGSEEMRSAVQKFFGA